MAEAVSTNVAKIQKPSQPLCWKQFPTLSPKQFSLLLNPQGGQIHSQQHQLLWREVIQRSASQAGKGPSLHFSEVFSWKMMELNGHVSPCFAMPEGRHVVHTAEKAGDIPKLGELTQTTSWSENSRCPQCPPHRLEHHVPCALAIGVSGPVWAMIDHG
jgi:hypothetical protein